MTFGDSTRNEVLNVLYDSTLENGITATLAGVFGKNVRMALPVSESVCAMPLETLGLGTRADNSLRRNRVRTVGDLCEFLASEDFSKTKNVGRKTVSEVKSKLLCYVYEMQMKPEERKSFLLDLLQKNLSPADAAACNLI